MDLLTPKELKVLRLLAENSERPQKQLAALAEISEPEFSRTKKDLFARGIIKRFTIEINYKEIGYPEMGVLFVSIIDKKSIKQTVEEIEQFPEAIAIFEVFGRDFDLVIKLMCKTNEHLRQVSEDITNLENIRAGTHTYTIIYSRIYKDTPGVPI